MKPPLLAAAFSFALLSASCGGKGPGEIPVLDVTASYPAKSIVLQDIAEVEYIPLETREGFLIDFFNVMHMDDEIVVIRNRNGDIMTFDRKTGKGLTSFNRTGRGPGEYSGGVSNIVVDKARGEMFVTPSFLHSFALPVNVYDLAGRHLRTLQFDSLRFPLFLNSYDGESMFFYRNAPTPDQAPPSEPYALLSKSGNTVTTLPVRFDGRDNMIVTVNEQVAGGVIMSRSAGAPIAKTRDGYMFSEPGIDTMYRWNREAERLIPEMTRTPSFGSMSYPIGLFFTGEGSDFMLLRTIERRYDSETSRGFDEVELLYDKRSGEFSEVSILNGDYVEPTETENLTPAAGLGAGVFAFGLQPFELLEQHEAGKLQGRLAGIVPGLKEDDNPVLMVVTFK